MPPAKKALKILALGREKTAASAQAAEKGRDGVLCPILTCFNMALTFYYTVLGRSVKGEGKTHRRWAIKGPHRRWEKMPP